MNPLFDNVVVSPIIETQQTASGFGLFSSQFKKGEVLFAGAGKPNCLPVVKVGDIILYDKDFGTPYDLNGKTVLFFTEDQIKAIL